MDRARANSSWRGKLPSQRLFAAKCCLLKRCRNDIPNLRCQPSLLPYRSCCSLSPIVYIFLLPIENILLGPQNTRASSLPYLPLLVPLVKSNCTLMRPSNIVQILHLVDSNDPVLTRESLIQGRKLWPFGWQTRATDTVLCLPSRKQVIVIEVAHFVPSEISMRALLLI